MVNNSLIPNVQHLLETGQRDEEVQLVVIGQLYNHSYIRTSDDSVICSIDDKAVRYNTRCDNARLKEILEGFARENQRSFIETSWPDHYLENRPLNWCRANWRLPTQAVPITQPTITLDEAIAVRRLNENMIRPTTISITAARSFRGLDFPF